MSSDTQLREGSDCESARGASGGSATCWQSLSEAVEGSRFQSLTLCPHFSFQFDLQRIVIYCDSRHAELETCCDIPSGPVSRDSHTARPAAEERVPRPRPPAGRGFSGPRNWHLGVRGASIISMWPRGSPAILARGLFPVQQGHAGQAVAPASVGTTRRLLAKR